MSNVEHCPAGHTGIGGRQFLDEWRKRHVDCKPKPARPTTPEEAAR